MRFPLIAIVSFLLTASAVLADIRADVRELFSRDMISLDFARVKIEVDRMIDPSIDVDAQLAQIDQMVATIWDKVETIRRYIYQVGAWNDGRAFNYDHDDPNALFNRTNMPGAPRGNHNNMMVTFHTHPASLSNPNRPSSADISMSQVMSQRYNPSTGYRYTAGSSLVINGRHEVVGFGPNGF